MKVDPYFKWRVLKLRPFLKIDWCRKVIEKPLKVEVQKDGRIQYWGYAPEMKGQIKVLRVIMRADGTLFNAFPDRDFQMKLINKQSETT
ncbi:MAG TPA: hypothetical protein VKX17_09635 [Planctomycetota bacterium]|nr:hypothetical protein [Planctomycetota bacterium]